MLSLIFSNRLFTLWSLLQQLWNPILFVNQCFQFSFLDRNLGNKIFELNQAVLLPHRQDATLTSVSRTWKFHPLPDGISPWRPHFIRPLRLRSSWFLGLGNIDLLYNSLFYRCRWCLRLLQVYRLRLSLVFFRRRIHTNMLSYHLLPIGLRPSLSLFGFVSECLEKGRLSAKHFVLIVTVLWCIFGHVSENFLG